ncbi:MAG: 50S ribosomal protein L35 [Spirochaetes bacterium]|nr:50S ribosomal protein L35 [Spirochaetota bacterium]MBN2770442.1 50S ribosomal protein L35 [Spirochaetota bacterium]HRX16355.1 50S ribosomal protein L35 [Spirochaetota bacterium]
MPKMKSNSGAKKRFKFTSSGKIKRAKAFANHMLECKSPQRKRNLRGTTVSAEADQKRIRRMLPYA